MALREIDEADRQTYRQHADECLELVRLSTDKHVRATFTAMAASWMKLASDERDREHAISLPALARLLGVSLRTLERLKSTGELAPSFLTAGGHARFTAEYAEALRLRAEMARGGGHKQVMPYVLSTGTVPRAGRPEPRPESAVRWARATAIKRRLTRRHVVPAVPASKPRRR